MRNEKAVISSFTVAIVIGSNPVLTTKTLNIKKIKVMEQKDNKYCTVETQFVKAAHQAACQVWKKKLEAKFPDLFNPYSVGDRIMIDSSMGKINYILCSNGGKFINLINLGDGNRWTDQTFEVEDPRNISYSDIKRLIGDYESFSKIEKDAATGVYC